MEVLVVENVIPVLTVCEADLLLILSHPLLMLILLHDDQVTTSLRIGILLEEIVRQTEGCHKVSMLEQKIQADTILAVEVFAGGDECHHTAIAHGIQSLLHEVAVDGLGNGTLHNGLAVGILWVEHLGISKRNIGDCKVELTQFRRFDTFKAFHTDVHAFIRM